MVIPLAPGEGAWIGLLPQLDGLADDAEILLVRSDRAPHEPATVHPRLREIVAPTGRARQMNAGACTARGTWLWFLHADSRLTPRTLPALRDFLARDEDALGYFDLTFRDDGPRLTRLNALGANLRSRLCGLPFGDQGLVLRAARLTALGGFDETAAYGEDHLLVWRARKAGVPLRRIPACLSTSARKYREHGWLATTARHLWRTAAQALPAALNVRR